MALCATASIVLGLSVAPTGAHAATPDRLMVHQDVRDGLPVDEVRALAQDDEGYLWIGTEVGVTRFDGHQTRSWPIGHPITRIAAGSGVVVAKHEGSAYELDTDDLHPLMRADGSRWVDVEDVHFDREGRLWVAASDGLHRRDRSGAWSQPYPELRDVHSSGIEGAASGLWVGADGRLWHVDDEHGATVRGMLRSLRSATMDRTGRDLVLEWHGNVFSVDDDGVHPMWPGVPIGGTIVARHDTVWVTNSETGLTGRGADGQPIHVAEDAGLVGTGPALVDREGSLWIGTHRGLVRLPEPDTVTYTKAHGLPSSDIVDLVFTSEGLWVSTTLGLVLMPVGSDELISAVPGTVHRTKELCVDSEGRLWTGSWIPERGLVPENNAFVVRHEGEFIEYPGEDAGWYTACATAADGGVWLAGYGGLFRGRSPARGPVAREGPPRTGTRDFYTAILEHEGSLWVTLDGRVCQADLVAIEAGHPTWSCEHVGENTAFTALVRTTSGELWAATRSHGLWWRHEGRWQRHPGSSELPSSTIYGIEVTKDGAWLLGSGFVWRVVDVYDPQRGWQVEESLGTWAGLPATAATSIGLGTDGTLWVGGRSGLTKLAAHARGTAPEPGPVTVVEVRADDQIVRGADRLSLPANTHVLSVRFSALAFRDPGALRYRFRAGPDGPWTEPTPDPVFTMFEPPSGEHILEVEASFDGRRWSATRALRLVVQTPWFSSWWAIAGGIALLAGLAWAAHRMRVAFVVGVEQQRSRIAMDLHDEIGSGLGSIGILASVVARRGAGDESRTRLANEIVDTAAELGTALGDIVWSLEPSSASLSALFALLRQRASQMCARADVELQTVYPDVWPEIRLSPTSRRNLALIGVEALHNVARHSRASHVALRLLPRGRQWVLEIEDDGCGLSDQRAPSVTSGRGLPSMRRRAEELGATLEIVSAAGQGTTVRVIFALRTRRWASLLRRDAKASTS